MSVVCRGEREEKGSRKPNQRAKRDHSQAERCPDAKQSKKSAGQVACLKPAQACQHINCLRRKLEETSIKAKLVSLRGSVVTKARIKADNSFSIFVETGLIPAHPVILKRRNDQKKLKRKKNGDNLMREFV